MLGPGVDLELADLRACQPVPRKHALDRLAQHLGWPALELFAQRPASQPARIAGMTVVHLRVELVAGDVDLLGVHDHDEVTGVDVRRVLRLALAAQRVGDLRSQTPERLSFGVDEIPAALDFTGLCVPGLHSGLDREAADSCPPARKCTNDAAGASLIRVGGRPDSAIQSAGSATATAPPMATLLRPSCEYARPPSSARAAPVDPESRSLKPTRRPRSTGRARSTSSDVAATYEKLHPRPSPKRATPVASMLTVQAS